MEIIWGVDVVYQKFDLFMSLSPYLPIKIQGGGWVSTTKIPAPDYHRELKVYTTDWLNLNIKTNSVPFQDVQS